jgi:hypothetical protein
MRLAALLVAFLLLAGSSAAQETFTLYVNQEIGFGIDFPGTPTTVDGTYTASQAEEAPKSTAPARIFSVTRPHAIYRLTVADFSAQMENSVNILGEAVDYLTNTESLRVDTSARIGMRNQAVFGRHLTYDRKDGGRSTMAFFFNKGRLFVVEAIILPSNPDVGSPLCFLPRC